MLIVVVRAKPLGDLLVGHILVLVDVDHSLVKVLALKDGVVSPVCLRVRGAFN